MYWLIDSFIHSLHFAPRPYLTGSLCPLLNHRSPMALLKFQMAPKLIHLISSGSRKKELRRICRNEAKASQSQRMWAEVSSFTPHPLHSRLSSSPSRWRCLLRVLCPVRRSVTALDWVLLKDRNLALAPGLGPEINSRACLGVLSMSRQFAQCWLISQWLSLFCVSSLDTPGAGSGPRYPRTEPPLASSSAISLPSTPAWIWTQ